MVAGFNIVTRTLHFFGCTTTAHRQFLISLLDKPGSEKIEEMSTNLELPMANVNARN